jgi:hypothetical protein
MAKQKIKADLEVDGIVKVGDRPVAIRAISFSASHNDLVIDNANSGHSFEESSRLIASTNNASFGFYDAVPTVTSSGSINLGHLNGFQSRIRYEGAASFTNDLSAGIRSFYSDIFISGSGNVPYTAGLYIQNATVTGTGRVQNQHGIIIGNLDAGTVSNRGIACYTYRNFLQGLAIGSDVLDLDNPLRVEGNGKFTGTVTASPATASTELATLAQVTANRPYKVYTALLSQSGTSAPVATVLENTLGVTISYIRNSLGLYQGTISSGTFDTSKTYTMCSFGDIQGTTSLTSQIKLTNSSSNFLISTQSSETYLDNLMTRHSIEIRVYN